MYTCMSNFFTLPGQLNEIDHAVIKTFFARGNDLFFAL